jgi:hypothetical protein
MAFDQYNAARHPPKMQDEEAEVEKIVRSRSGGDGLQFLLESPSRARRAKLRKPFDDLDSRAVTESVLSGAVFHFPDEDALEAAREERINREAWDWHSGTDVSFDRSIPGPNFSQDVDGDTDSEDELLLKPSAAMVPQPIAMPRSGEVAVTTAGRRSDLDEHLQMPMPDVGSVSDTRGSG